MSIDHSSYGSLGHQQKLRQTHLRKCPVVFHGFSAGGILFLFHRMYVQLAGAGMGLLLGIQQAIVWVKP